MLLLHPEIDVNIGWSKSQQPREWGVSRKHELASKVPSLTEVKLTTSYIYLDTHGY